MGTSEDTVFGALMAYADLDAVAAHLPYGVIHDSTRSPEWGAIPIATREARFADVLVSVVGQSARNTRAVGTEVRLQRLGTEVSDLSHVSDAELVRVLVDAAVGVRARQLAELDEWLRSVDAPARWSQAADEYRSSFVASSVSPGFFIPREFKGEKSTEVDYEPLRAALRQFGELLAQWPAMWTMAQQRSERWMETL
jgi:hypothetical protein